MLNLTYRKASSDPPGYRIKFDDIEVGSVAKRQNHAQGNREYWHWGVDTMPIMDHGGRPPSNEAATFPAALEAFKAAFSAWHAQLDPALWAKNRDYIAYCADRWKRR